MSPFRPTQLRHHVVAAIALLVVLTGCSGKDGSTATTTTRKTTSTTSATTTSTTTSTTAPPSTTTTTRAATTTTKAAARPDCTSRAVIGGVSAVQAPAQGTYRYVRCANGAAAYDVAVGSGAAGDQRTVTWSASFGDVTGLNSYGSSVTQATATIRPKSVSATLQCTWDHPLVIYPAQLAMNSSWRTDGRCDMDFRQSLQFNRFSRVTGLRSFNVGGQAVRVLLVEETTDLLYVDNPRRNSTSFHSESTIFFDPVRGLPVYERRISEATGQYPQAKTTTEVVLGSFSPS
jgi:hypothetical protein